MVEMLVICALATSFMFVLFFVIPSFDAPSTESQSSKAIKRAESFTPPRTLETAHSR